MVDRVARAQGYLLTKQGKRDTSTAHLVSVLTGETKDKGDNTFALRVLARERLRDWLMQGIVMESKQRGLYTSTGNDSLVEKCVYVRKCKSISEGLRAEVDNWLMRFRLLHAHVPSLSEALDERKNRLEEFWSVYHDRSRVLESGPPSRTKYGMQWSVKSAGVQQWQIKNPMPGTLAHVRLVNEGQRSPSKSLMGERTASAPNLQLRSRSKGGAESRPSSGGNRMRVELPPISNSRHRYLQECETRKKIPTPLPFITGHSNKFSAEGRDLVDNELLAMASMLQEMNCVEEVNLHDNSLLTDRSLTPFLRQLGDEPIVTTLQRLNLGRCLRAGPASHEATLRVLKGGGGLRHLSLSQVPIATRLQLPLCQAIGRHPSLLTVNLVETGLGSSYVADQCLGSLIGSRTITTLDIGWNTLKGDVLDAFGERLRHNHNLRSLKLANTSATQGEPVPPLSRFLEHLAYNKSLTHLDITMNRCDFKSALVMEDSLDTHKKLAELIVSDNPLSVLGVRSILRLLAREHTGLKYFDIDNCYSGDQDATMKFSYTNPGGKYELELWRPYHRSLLRMLYKTADRFGLPFDVAFSNIQYNKPGFAHAVKDMGVYEVLREGTLKLNFNVDKAMEAGIKNVGDADYFAFLQAHYHLTRFMPGYNKVIPLFARWKDLDGRPESQRVFVNALAKDFNLTLPYLEYMAKASATFLNETMWRLMPSIPLDTTTQYLASLIFPRLSDYILIQQKMSQLIDFNIDNPSGHYKLDLGNCCEYAIAERLLLLDRWEAAVDKRIERFDISSRGNGSHIRNELYQGRPLSQYASVAEWKLPELGECEFDYISNRRPPKGAEVLSDDLWEHILTELHASTCSTDDKIVVMRTISNNFHISSKHMRMLLGYFRSAEDRSEVFIIFYLRIVDMCNAKIFRVRFGSMEEIVKLQRRLGYASFFPFLQPENAKFELDLSAHDQRLCASMFVQLATKENMYNLRDYGWTRADGTEDPMATGVPRSWGEFKSIPQAGVFRATYMCAPEHRNFEFRKQLATTYGFFAVEHTEEEVMWWTGLMEPPSDVVDLLEFLIGRYTDVQKPFQDIDGVGGNGFITLREFEEGLTEIGCTKFDGPNRAQRIDAIFRYLDPGGEGSVSREEWDLLNQLWKEFDLSIKEFVHFLCLCFGPDLHEAWTVMDEDGSGEMDLDEWTAAVQKIGYFGPANVVFALLDTTDDNNISFEEFAVLEKHKPDSFKEDAAPRRTYSRKNTDNVSSRKPTAVLGGLNLPEVQVEGEEEAEAEAEVPEDVAEEPTS